MSVCKESEPGSQVVNIPCALCSRKGMVTFTSDDGVVRRRPHSRTRPRSCTQACTRRRFQGSFLCCFPQPAAGYGLPHRERGDGRLSVFSVPRLPMRGVLQRRRPLQCTSHNVHPRCVHRSHLYGVLRCGAVAQTRAVFRDTWRTVVALSQLTLPQSSAAPASRSGSTTGPPARPATRPSATTRSHRCEPLLRLPTAFWAACGWPARCRAAPGRAT